MQTIRTTGTVAGLLAVIIICAQSAQAGTLPTAPSSPSPLNLATGISTGKALSWSASGATSYDVYFGTGSTPGKVATVLLPSILRELSPSTRYYWKIVAKNASGTASSPIWSFTTAAKSTTSKSTVVNCVMSSWALSSATAWGACSAGVQSRSETWTRSILVQPSNGGTACGATTMTVVATLPCSLTSAPLLQKSDLTYEGAFRVPGGTGTASYAYGGTALTYNASHNSLFLVGHDWYQRVGEISIPTAGQGATVADLPRAATLQPLTDVLQGKLTTIDGNISNGVKIGGLVVLPNSLAVSAWSYYDAGTTKQTKSHFMTGQNFASLGTVAGPFQVGIGFQNIVPTDTSRIGGFVSGYMAAIPSGWQSLLGGTHLTGQGGMVSILDRTSSGPSATVFTPAELGVPNSPTKLVMGYPSHSSNNKSPLHHPSLGTWGINGGLYNGTQGFRGMVFPEGTRSILFFGWGGTTFCYGAGTSDPALNNQLVPGSTQHYCYDPTNSSTGTHGYPYKGLVFAYDVYDFIRVKQGLKQPWEIVPYATWTFTLPFQSTIVNGVEVGTFQVVGAAYDPAGKRLFLSAAKSDGAAPVIHVLRLP
jgi:hypothetical protein